MRTLRSARRILPLALTAAVLGSCATNPVTGRSELSLISESSEISMGRQGAQEVVQSLGLVQDSALQAYVSSLGKQMAARSERPQLPWSFAVVDDPVVNAFALPGGFIFVTRGILGHFNSEAELVAVLGHEIGHVTAKHSVRQISRAQVAQLGLGVGMILKPELAEFGQAAGAGLGLLFLKFGRDDETQADDLGFRYSLDNGYDVREMVSVFKTLGRLSGGGGDRVPEWLSTHPDPGNRVAKTEERIASLSRDLTGMKVNRESYLRRLEGLAFGENPRAGYFEGGRFFHPDLAFQVDFPDGWKTQNQTSAVVGVSAEQDAALQLTLEGGDPASAARQFLAQQGVQAGATSAGDINGLPARSATFTAQTERGQVAGLVTFLSHGNRTYRILCYTSADKYRAYDAVFRRAATSFRRLTDPTKLDVQPATIDLVRLPSAMTIAEFNRRYPSKISEARLALMNGVTEAETMPAGRTVKRVVGGR